MQKFTRYIKLRIGEASRSLDVISTRKNHNLLRGGQSISHVFLREEVKALQPRLGATPWIRQSLADWR